MRAGSFSSAAGGGGGAGWAFTAPGKVKAIPMARAIRYRFCFPEVIRNFPALRTSSFTVFDATTARLNFRE